MSAMDTINDTDLTTEPSGTINLFNITNVRDKDNSSRELVLPQDDSTMSVIFEVFIITEIVMTAMELVISIAAALRISRWRRNYRNQMLMQLSLARFIKRTIFFIQFIKEKYKIISMPSTRVVLMGSQIYIDLVITILVCFFIKHMYDSVLVVIIKISKKSLYKVLYCSWLIPIPVTGVWILIMCYKILNEWTSYLIICLALRWPIILIGTVLYLTILYRVTTDRIRRFATSLTVITFLLCFIINFYLLCKDIIILWCFESFMTLLINYILGFMLNFLVLCSYVLLIILCIKSKTKSCDVLADNSVANVL